MFELTVNKESVVGSANPHVHNFLASVGDAVVGIYTTSVVNGLEEKRRFTFVTTSKDVHLDLGRMNSVAHFYLAKLLEWEFDHHPKDAHLLLCIPKFRLLATQSKQSDKTVFTLSPVR